MSEYDRLGDFIAAIARPGAVWMTSGERGGGKTHTAVAIAERMVKGRFPQLPKIVVATNIIFYHKVDGQIRVEPPPGVFHIRTMRDFFPIVVDSIRTYGRDVLIVLILDEAQGFVGGDLNSTNASIPMKEFLGTIRKYNSMVWFLTPSAKQLGPAFRNLINAKTPGNLTCRWKKDLALNERWIKANGLKCTPKQLMIVRPYDHEPAFIQIPVTEWTGTVDGLEEGQYCYDHEASATFREGKGFCFNDFNDYMGGIASINAMDAIEEYYRTQIGDSEEGGATPVRSEADIERESKAKLYSRMMLSGMKQQDAADMIGVARSTLNGFLRHGVNQIEATVRYYGCGTFHQIPQRAGFLAQLELTDPDQLVVTDGNWLAAKMPQWVERTVKATIQQPPLELFDASQASGLEWKPASIICGAEAGPWRGLHERDCKQLSRREFLFRRFAGGSRVQPEPLTLAFPVQQLLFPGDTTVNNANLLPFLAAFIVESPQAQIVHLGLENLKVSVNGRSDLNGEVSLNAGANLFVAAVSRLYGHQPDCEVSFPADAGVSIHNCYSSNDKIPIESRTGISGLSYYSADESSIEAIADGFGDEIIS